MKTLLRKTAIVATLALTLAASTFTARAQEGLVYSKATNRNIGITVENATGANFTIKDKNGNVILQGTVKSDKTFFIPTGKFSKGTYKFYIGHLAVQEFTIK